MKLTKIGLAAALVAMAFTSVASADTCVVWSDGFEDYTPGLNWGGEGPWDVTDGSVDLIGSGYGPTPHADGGSYFIDLDGSRDTPGILQTTVLAGKLVGGQEYSLSFLIGGNARNYPADTVTVGLRTTSGWSESITLESDDEWYLYTTSFVYVDGDELFFQNSAANPLDYRGAVLDNVTITQECDPVPEPASMALLGIGLAGLGMRRFRKQG